MDFNPSASGSQHSSAGRLATTSTSFGTSNNDVGDSNSGSSPSSTPRTALPSINLPKGGGAIRDIGEKFQVNGATGTGSTTIPIQLSSSRSGPAPELTLSYDTGSGNGPFGFGWHLSNPSVTRKTNKGLPLYQDEEESDIFVMAGMEDLVPLLDLKDGKWVRKEDSLWEKGGCKYQIRQYRPRVEASFSRIERWTELSSRKIHWVTITGDNVTNIYGESDNAQILDPDSPHGELRIFTWLLSRSYDDRGHAYIFEYKAENDDGVNFHAANEINRTKKTRSAQRYLKRVKYGNLVSHLQQPDWERAGWMFEVVFDYGEHSEAKPSSEEVRPWDIRPDPFSSYRSTFELRTYRLCRRIMMFHHFPDEPGIGNDCLVTSLNLSYHHQKGQTFDQGNRIASFVSSMTQQAYQRQDGGYLDKALPPLEFKYSLPIVTHDIRELDLASLDDLPAGIDDDVHRWLDLDGEGIPGVLIEQDGYFYYKPNLGEGRLGPVRVLDDNPNTITDPQAKTQWLDLDADGHLEMVQTLGNNPGFYERDPQMHYGWAKFQPFQNFPVEVPVVGNPQFIDLNGDGLSDILIANDEVFTWYASWGKSGWSPANYSRTALDEEKGPRILVSDVQEAVYTADMSGDGLADLVRIRNGEICYWPNLGYGQFGKKIAMDNSPWFDYPDTFQQKRLRLFDIDGSGTTDLIYLSGDGAFYYQNESGNSWSGPNHIKSFPKLDDLSHVQVVDLLGRGTGCLVWSSFLLGDAGRQIRYIDLMGEGKPYLLVRTSNNLGAETRVHYTSSVKFYLKDKHEGRPWATRLAFPVQVVERIEAIEHISRSLFVQTYSYHDGYFDGVEREFNGFGMVESIDTESFGLLQSNALMQNASNVTENAYVPPVLAKTWYHTGTYFERDKVTRYNESQYYREPNLSDEQWQAMVLEDTALPRAVRKDTKDLPFELSVEERREACRALKGRQLRQETYSLDNSQLATVPVKVSDGNFTLLMLQPQAQNRYAAFFSKEFETLECHYERNPVDPRITQSFNISLDDFGNVIEHATVAYGRRNARIEQLLTPEDRAVQEKPQMTYSCNQFTSLVSTLETRRNPMPATAQVFQLYPKSDHSATCRHPLFRSRDLQRLFATATDGRHDLPYEDFAGLGAHDAHVWRRLIEHKRNLFRANDLSHILPLGTVQSRAVPYQSYSMTMPAELAKSIFVAPERFTTTSELCVAMKQLGYVQFESEKDWWLPSGKNFFSPASTDGPPEEYEYARKHFFQPLRYRDQYYNEENKSEWLIKYDKYDLLLQETCDPLRNRVTIGQRNVNPTLPLMASGQDYRLLAPRLISDPNLNLSGIAYDVLGHVVGSALMGKDGLHQGDSFDGFEENLSESVIQSYFEDPVSSAPSLLGHASTRYVYDIYAFWRAKERGEEIPTAMGAISRSIHDANLKPGESPGIMQNIAYFDGVSRTAQHKVYAGPGSLDRDDLKGGSSVVPHRFICSGWTVYNNKAKPVLKYEPFYTPISAYENDAKIGVATTIFHDSLGRVLGALFPDQTWSKTVFESWSEQTWDSNDTVLENPLDDPTVGDYFRRFFPLEDQFISWFQARINGALGIPEKAAATKTRLHASTPTDTYYDSLGRKFLSIEQNVSLDRHDNPMRELVRKFTVFDIQGNVRSVIDALSRKVCLCDYTMSGVKIHQTTMEAGELWTLHDATGNTGLAWDSRHQKFRTTYDVIHRSLATFLTVYGSPEIMIEKIVYGESAPDPGKLNLRTELIGIHDQAGILTSDAFDFKGNLVHCTRKFATQYKGEINWQDSVTLNEDTFVTETSFDAANRKVKVVFPDKSCSHYSYDEVSRLKRVTAKLKGSDLLTDIAKSIQYNARNQQTFVERGNHSSTVSEYNPFTFRLEKLQTFRHTPSSTHENFKILQHLHYTYDPIGNVVHLEDRAQERIFFRNKVVNPTKDFTYDALYRVIDSKGREHIAQSKCFLGTSSEFRGDGDSMARYCERYTYDKAGNITEIAHDSTDSRVLPWRKRFLYEEQSQIETEMTSNRLSEVVVGNKSERFMYAGSAGITGNITSMSTLPLMEWDYKNELSASAKQAVDLGATPETTYYRYDSRGTRVRKVTERYSKSGEIATVLKERVYVGSFEEFRKFNGAGSAIYEEETLRLGSDDADLVLAETRKEGQGKPLSHLLRFQIRDLLNSVSIELGDNAELLSFEEYSAYGESTYQALRHDLEEPKRYRFSGKELDTENGLYYYGARYYSASLCRWISCDPGGFKDGENLYQYTQGNPVSKKDSNGMEASWGTRAWGGLKAVGGALEIAAGAAGIAAPTGVSQVLGVVAVVHGTDTLISGLKQAWTGEESKTLTQEGAEVAAKKLGATDRQAEITGEVVDFAAGIIPEAGIGAARAGAKFLSKAESGIQAAKSLIKGTPAMIVDSAKSVATTVKEGTQVLAHMAQSHGLVPVGPELSHMGSGAANLTENLVLMAKNMAKKGIGALPEGARAGAAAARNKVMSKLMEASEKLASVKPPGWVNQLGEMVQHHLLP